MIETIKKSVETLEENYFEWMTKEQRRKALLTSHITLLNNLIKELEGKKKEMNHHTCGIDKSNGCCVECSHLAEYNQALTDTITTLQALKKEITSLIKRIMETKEIKICCLKEITLLLESIEEEVEKIDVSGGGSGRRLKEQVLDLISSHKGEQGK
jgi:chromosome segregation ATPase